MRNTNKKGFTIVELVIVIAVIAILSAVLIPTFSGIIAKANLSADQVAIKNMNTVLATEFATVNPASVKEVVDALDENGFNVDALTPLTKGHKFFWNAGTKTIVLVNAEDVVVYPENAELAAEHKDLNADGASYINKEVNNATDLKTALEKGNDVTLTANIENAAEIIIPAGSDVTLDLGGFKYITESANPGEIAQTSKYIKVSEGATLTIQNGTFEGRGIMNNGGIITIKDGTTINAVDVNGGACIKNKTGGTVIIEGGTFNVPNFIEYDSVNKGGAGAVENAGGTVIIKGGTFTTNTEAYLISNLSGEMTIEGGTFKSYRGVLACEGGTLNVISGTFTLENHPDTGKAPSGHHLYCIAGTVTLGSDVEFKGLADKIYVDGGTLNDNR